MKISDLSIPFVYRRNHGATHARPPPLAAFALKHLRLIDALARSGNLYKVAIEMNMMQPAATKILQDAEAIPGAQLFERRPRGMILTDIGAFAAD